MTLDTLKEAVLTPKPTPHLQQQKINLLRQPRKCSPCDVKVLLAATFVALHARSSLCFPSSTLLFTDVTSLQANGQHIHRYSRGYRNSWLGGMVLLTGASNGVLNKWRRKQEGRKRTFTHLVETLRRQSLQYYRFHRLHVSKPCFRNVQRTYNMTPPWKAKKRQFRINVVFACIDLSDKPLFDTHHHYRSFSRHLPFVDKVHISATKYRNTYSNLYRSNCDNSCQSDISCGVLTTLAALSCDSHFRQNHGPEGTCMIP